MLVSPDKIVDIIKTKCIDTVLIDNAPETDRKDLLSELELMKTLKPHPHVINLLGCVSDSGKVVLRIIGINFY